MKLQPWHIFTVSLILLSGVLANPVLGNEMNDDAIALWAADQFNLSQPFEMPVVHYVDKATLGLAFEVGNKQSYFRWQEEYGVEKADEMMEEFLNNIVGLFNEKSQIIYVGNFIDPCSQQAIFAHEMVHYFQHLKDGVVPAGSYGADMERFRREMQAYDIEGKFRAAFCEEDKDPATGL